MTQSKRIVEIQRDKSRELKELLIKQHQQLQQAKEPAQKSSSSSSELQLLETLAHSTSAR